MSRVAREKKWKDTRYEVVVAVDSQRNSNSLYPMEHTLNNTKDDETDLDLNNLFENFKVCQINGLLIGWNFVQNKKVI